MSRPDASVCCFVAEPAVPVRAGSEPLLSTGQLIGVIIACIVVVVLVVVICCIICWRQRKQMREYKQFYFLREGGDYKVCAAVCPFSQLSGRSLIYSSNHPLPTHVLTMSSFSSARFAIRPCCWLPVCPNVPSVPSVPSVPPSHPIYTPSILAVRPPIYSRYCPSVHPPMNQAVHRYNCLPNYSPLPAYAPSHPSIDPASTVRLVTISPSVHPLPFPVHALSVRPSV